MGVRWEFGSDLGFVAVGGGGQPKLGVRYSNGGGSDRVLGRGWSGEWWADVSWCLGVDSTFCNVLRFQTGRQGPTGTEED